MNLSPMEQMAVSVLGKLTGFTPEQMQTMATEGVGFLRSADSRLKTIEEGLATILDHIQKETDDGK